MIPAAPTDLVRVVRAWDFAATEPSGASPDPDWTRGVKMGRQANGRYVVLDVVGTRGSPHVVERMLKNTADQDGVKVHVRIPQDPGSAGKVVKSAYSLLLAGKTVHGEPVTGDKEDRARPFSAQVEAGNVDIVAGPWNAEFLSELQGFPTLKHDDIVDASSDAFNYLAPSGAAARFRMLASR